MGWEANLHKSWYHYNADGWNHRSKIRRLIYCGKILIHIFRYHILSRLYWQPGALVPEHLQPQYWSSPNSTCILFKGLTLRVMSAIVYLMKQSPVCWSTVYVQGNSLYFYILWLVNSFNIDTSYQFKCCKIFFLEENCFKEKYFDWNIYL